MLQPINPHQKCMPDVIVDLHYYVSYKMAFSIRRSAPTGRRSHVGVRRSALARRRWQVGAHKSALASRRLQVGAPTSAHAGRCSDEIG